MVVLLTHTVSAAASGAVFRLRGEVSCESVLVQLGDVAETHIADRSIEKVQALEVGEIGNRPKILVRDRDALEIQALQLSHGSNGRDALRTDLIRIYA